jgi:hypothetical protein
MTALCPPSTILLQTWFAMKNKTKTYKNERRNRRKQWHWKLGSQLQG